MNAPFSTCRRLWVTTFLLLSLVGAARGAPVAAADNAPGGAGDGPPIDITCIGLMAPAVVHVKSAIPRDAAGNPLGSPLDFRYEWDFGDAASQWNNLPGWNAAHVYDKPGQYAITLTVRGKDGHELHRTIAIRIAPDERKRIYVSADGNDGLDGGTAARAVRSPARAFHLAKENCWVLFRKGDVFDISTPVHLYGRGMRIGNYSKTGGDPWANGVPLEAPGGSKVFVPPPDDPLPVLRKVAAPPKNESMFYLQPKSEDTLVQGIEFDSMWDLKSEYGVKKVPARAFTVGGTNFGVRWCSFRNLTDAINTEMRPTGVLVLDNHFSKEIRGYCVYANGSDHVYVGNVMTHSHQEHLIRATEPGVTRLLIAYNDLSRPNKGKGCIELRMASWFFVSGNYINNGTLRVGPQELDKNQFPKWREYKCEWGVVQDNRLDELFFNVRLGTYHLEFRNNIIRNDPKPGPPRPEDGDWCILIACDKPGWDDVRKALDVRIEHNTIINLMGHGDMLFVQGRPIGLVVRNNVYITGTRPGTAAAIFSTAADLEGFDVIDDNLMPNGSSGMSAVNKQRIDRPAWQRAPMVRGERYGPIAIDADDNVPIETGAGAKLGDDKRERDSKKGTRRE